MADTEDNAKAEPVAALMTPLGRGAVATIRLRGGLERVDAEPALFRATNGRLLKEQPVGRICFGRWGEEPSEEVVVCRTGEDEAEIHCHGGRAAPARVLGDLDHRGFAVRRWTELVAVEADSFTAECQAALTRATTLRTATILLQQASGRLRSALEELVAVAAAGKEAPPATERSSAAPDRQRGRLLRGLTDLLRWSDFGLHLTEPWSVVLVGRPNVGKSSLINALLGYTRAIVYDQPGTTRDVVSAETALDGWPVRLFDTAGLRDLANRADSAAELERAGIQRAQQQLQAADCRLLLIDIGEPATAVDRELLTDWPDAIVVAHKCDRPVRWDEPLPEGAVRVSSLTGQGLEELIRRIVSRLVPELPPEGAALPITPRQVDCLRRAKEAVDRGDIDACRCWLEECLNPREVAPAGGSSVGVKS